MSGQQGGYGQPPNMQQQQMMYNQQHMMGRPMGQMGVQRQMYGQDSGMPQQQGQMQMHFAPQQQQMQMGQPQMNQMPQLQQQQPQQQGMGFRNLCTNVTNLLKLGSMLGGSLGSVSQQHMQMQQPRSPMTTGSVGPQQLTPGGGPGSQAPGSTLAAASAGGPTSVGPMSVQPHTPMNPASQQTLAQPSSVQPGPASVAPATPASNQPAPQASSSTAVEPTHPYLQDPVAHSKQLIMKDLRFSIIDLNRRAGEALKDLRAGNTPSNSNEYLKAMDNLFAVCDEIEGNLILVCETQKQMSKMEKIFDKDAMRAGEQHVGFSDLKGRHMGGDDDSGAHLSAVNTYIDQTKQLQAAFDRAFSHVGRTLETIRRRQNMGSKIPKIEGIMDMDC
ncbi:hypothetical protein ANCCAN_14240 [Ancylostoma caninum]|uniref:Mediator of RNA polymerase II transcription subunit 29 n=1 Tax=Ancylostoma caninum TaxID=29170 RepID=A0A368G5Z6_ANCCA|nr:hypothetical protein ANCCAN_14240 [Ancylostoma caninum]